MKIPAPLIRKWLLPKHLVKHEVLTPLTLSFRFDYSEKLVTINVLMKAYGTGLQVDIAIIDFSQTFDTVSTRNYY